MQQQENPDEEEQQQHSLPWGLRADSLAPSSLEKAKTVNFTFGSVKKTPFQKHKEAVEAKKKKEEEETQAVLDEFVQSFSGDSKKEFKSFVKGEKIVNNQVVETSFEERVYKPKTTFVPSFVPPSSTTESKEPPKKGDKKKRSIDELKDELKKFFFNIISVLMLTVKGSTTS